MEPTPLVMLATVCSGSATCLLVDYLKSHAVYLHPNPNSGNKKKDQQALQAKLASVEERLKQSQRDKQRAKERSKKREVMGCEGQSAFIHCLFDPFSDRAVGAQVPDMFSAPTLTERVHFSTTLFSSPTGVINYMFFAHPFFTALQGAGTMNSVSSGGLSVSTLSNYLLTLTTPSALANTFSTFRVVGGGIRIRAVSSVMNTSGRVLVGSVQPTGIVLGPQKIAATGITVNSATLSQLTTISAGLNGMPAQNITQLVDETEATLANLLSKEITIPFNASAPEAFMWVNTSQQTQYGTTSGSPVYLGQSGGFYTSNGTEVRVSGQSDLASQERHGFDITCLYADGLPVSAACLELEYILHVEGTPPISTVNNAGLFVPATTEPGPINPGLLDWAAQAARNIDFDKLITNVGETASWVARAVSAGHKAAETFAPLLAF
jgi:hypothetical protein